MEEQTNQQQREALDDAIEQGVAFEEMVRSKGWGFIKAYYQVQVQSFATDLLISDKPIEAFAAMRHELQGLRKLMGFIDGVMETARKEHDKPKQNTA